jgi:protein mago nashi
MTAEGHDEFYLRYYVGHEADQLEYILTPNGKLTYSNTSHYHGENMIQKSVCVSPAVVDEFRRIVLESGINSVDDSNWEPVSFQPEYRRQELEIKVGNEHLAFTCEEIGSLSDVMKSKDPEGLEVFYYITQDLKCLAASLLSLHFKIKPI